MLIPLLGRGCQPVPGNSGKKGGGCWRLQWNKRCRKLFIHPLPIYKVGQLIYLSALARSTSPAALLSLPNLGNILPFTLLHIGTFPV